MKPTTLLIAALSAGWLFAASVAVAQVYPPGGMDLGPPDWVDPEPGTTGSGGGQTEDPGTPGSGEGQPTGAPDLSPFTGGGPLDPSQFGGGGSPPPQPPEGGIRTLGDTDTARLFIDTLLWLLDWFTTPFSEGVERMEGEIQRGEWNVGEALDELGYGIGTAGDIGEIVTDTQIPGVSRIESSGESPGEGPGE